MDSIYVIAECAQGYAAASYDESIALALLLTRCAKSAGADAVKFQLVIASELATPDYKYYDLFKTLELGFNGWTQVASLAKHLDIDLIFDIFGSSSLQMAESLGSYAVKIHPTDFSNIRLINDVASSSILNIIAGCGGASYSEIITTVNSLVNSKSLTLLHGFQGYPTSCADNCLSRLRFLDSFINKSQNPIMLGFADHADPLSPDSTHLAATALGYGVSVFEKHLTIAKCLRLEDHESALSPDEFLNFVNTLRSCSESKSSELVMDTTFEIPHAEKSYRRAVERHVVAANDLCVGQIIAESDVCLKRTATTKPITELQFVIGKTLMQNMKADSPFTSDSFEK